MARVDFEDDRTPFDDLVALHTTDDAGELHRRLLCFGSGMATGRTRSSRGACSTRSTRKSPKARW
jgi:hypothetical protein